jgi:hypothetical protein
MAARPNFTDVRLENGTLRVEGKSDDDISDLLEIRVVLVQGDSITRGSVDQISSVWHADLSASGSSGDFTTGDAVAFGVETRSGNFLTMTWTEPVTIH